MNELCNPNSLTGNWLVSNQSFVDATLHSILKRGLGHIWTVVEIISVKQDSSNRVSFEAWLLRNNDDMKIIGEMVLACNFGYSTTSKLESQLCARVYYTAKLR